MANIWVVSDWHFGHANMLSFKDEAGRLMRTHPVTRQAWTSAEEVDEFMVDAHNAVVRPQDHVYCLGDVVLCTSAPTRRALLQRTVGRLKGHLRLVRGNHDIFRTKEYLQYFDEIYACRVLSRLLLTHIPVHPGSLGRQRANVHGHLHEKVVTAVRSGAELADERYVNVSVEQTAYAPVPLESIHKLLDERGVSR
jgi:calcineurin-like phosphoesterase family protein